MMLGVSFIRRTPIDAKGAMPETIFDNAKRILLATVLTSLCWALPGCQSITPTTTYAEIRFIDASYNAGGIDIYEGTSAIIYNGLHAGLVLRAHLAGQLPLQRP